MHKNRNNHKATPMSLFYMYKTVCNIIDNVYNKLKSSNSQCTKDIVDCKTGGNVKCNVKSFIFGQMPCDTKANTDKNYIQHTHTHWDQ